MKPWVESYLISCNLMFSVCLRPCTPSFPYLFLPQNESPLSMSSVNIFQCSRESMPIQSQLSHPPPPTPPSRRQKHTFVIMASSLAPQARLPTCYYCTGLWDWRMSAVGDSTCLLLLCNAEESNHLVAVASSSSSDSPSSSLKQVWELRTNYIIHKRNLQGNKITPPRWSWCWTWIHSQSQTLRSCLVPLGSWFYLPSLSTWFKTTLSSCCNLWGVSLLS